MGQNLEESKQAKKERIEKAIAQLDRTLAETSDQDEQRARVFKEQTNELFNKLEDEQGQREVSMRVTAQEEDDGLSKEIKSFQNQMQVKITKCKNVLPPPSLVVPQGERVRPPQTNRRTRILSHS